MARVSRLGHLRVLAGDCKGALLLETIIAAMVFALLGVAVLAGLNTAYTSGSLTEEQATAENVARNQVEHIFQEVYREPEQTPYPTMTGIPDGYSVETTVEFEDTVDPDPEVEKITVSSQRDGKEVLTLQTLRGRADGLQLRYSFSNDRSNSARLHGATLTCSCDVFVFLDDPEGKIDDQVEFRLDGNLEQTEYFINWDFKGSEGSDPSDLALPWDITGLFNKEYEIKATPSLLDGNTVNITAKFNISN